MVEEFKLEGEDPEEWFSVKNSRSLGNWILLKSSNFPDVYQIQGILCLYLE